MRKVTLPNPHWHEGKLYKVGEEIELTEEQHVWLMKAIGQRRSDHQAEVEAIPLTIPWLLKRERDLAAKEAHNNSDGEAGE